MIAKMFLVNVFADGLFSGAKAAVVFLRNLDQEVYLQALAEELSLPLTVCVLRGQTGFQLRYFTPRDEINSLVCGNLAAAGAVYDAGLAPPDQPVWLEARDGRYSICRSSDFLDRRLSQTVERREPCFATPEMVEKLAGILSLGASEIRFAVEGEPGHLLAALRRQGQLEAANLSRAALSALSMERVSLSAPLEGGGSGGYSMRQFSFGRESSPLDLELHSLLAGLWAEQIGGRRLEIHHHLGQRNCRLWAEISTDGATVQLSGQVSPTFRADTMVQELMPGNDYRMFF